RRGQPVRLAGREQAQAGAHLDVGVLGLERLDRLAHPDDVPVGPAAGAGDPAYAPSAPGYAGLGIFYVLVGLEPGVLEHLGRRADPLTAVEAVLGAQPALDVDQVVQLDPAAEEAAAAAERAGHHVEQLVVTAGEHRQRLLPRRELAVHCLV